MLGARPARGVLALGLLLSACSPRPPAPRSPRPLEPIYGVVAPAPAEPPAAPAEPAPPAPPAEPPAVEPLPLAGPDQIAFWRDGRQVLIDRLEARHGGAFVLDVGREWVPPLFRSTPGEPHAYEPHYVALSNERFGGTPEGRRAELDRYLELYGIPPTPAVLRNRFETLKQRECAHEPMPRALRSFDGVEWDEDGAAPEQPVPPEVLEALQARLRCSGHLRRAGSGVLDRLTRRALEEFERRHRIYARGSLDGATLEALKASPLELERRALVRVLTERLTLELGVIEDGSALGARPGGGWWSGAAIAEADDVVSHLRRRLETALDLETVEGVGRFYRGLAGALDRPHHALAVDPIALPDYHSADMELRVEIDRGDVYYDFPFDASGHPVAQPLERYPTLTLFARDGPVWMPLARYGTTIGGWRVQRHRGQDVFGYKESPVGSSVWAQIVSAPVWLPPPAAHPSSLVKQAREQPGGEVVYEINENLVGPGYASAYGLVAAYHLKVSERHKHKRRTDEGIRTHGSSDYTSVWQRVSLGCHRLHNHLAIRLFNFILAHREHRRSGHRPVRFRRSVKLDDFSTVIEVQRTGYAFDLVRPILVDTLPGTLRGTLQKASTRRIPVSEVQMP